MRTGWLELSWKSPFSDLPSLGHPHPIPFHLDNSLSALGGCRRPQQSKSILHLFTLLTIPSIVKKHLHSQFRCNSEVCPLIPLSQRFYMFLGWESYLGSRGNWERWWFNTIMNRKKFCIGNVDWNSALKMYLSDIPWPGVCTLNLGLKCLNWKADVKRCTKDILCPRNQGAYTHAHMQPCANTHFSLLSFSSLLCVYIVHTMHPHTHTVICHRMMYSQGTCRQSLLS